MSRYYNENVLINNTNGCPALKVLQEGLNEAVQIFQNNSEDIALRVEKNTHGSATALAVINRGQGYGAFIYQAGNAPAVMIERHASGSTQSCLAITNNGIGPDIQGSNWRVDKNGGAQLASIQVNGPTTPSSASAPGTQGKIVWDNSYVYVCVAPNTWKRASLTSW